MTSIIKLILETNFIEYFFILASTLTILFSVRIIFTSNPIKCVLYLILTYLTSAILLCFLGLDFFAMILIIVYVGSIAVLFIFVIMMLNIREKKNILTSSNSFIYVILFFLLFFTFKLIYTYSLIHGVSDFQTMQNNSIDKTTFLTIFANLPFYVGYYLYEEYYLIFLLCGLVLLISMIASINIALTARAVIRKQNSYNQIDVKYSKNIYLKDYTKKEN